MKDVTSQRMVLAAFTLGVSSVPSAVFSVVPASVTLRTPLPQTSDAYRYAFRTSDPTGVSTDSEPVAVPPHPSIDKAASW